MKAMLLLRQSCLCLLMLLAVMANIASAASVDWTWISADDKYSKFYAPSEVQVTKKSTLKDGRTVATEIRAMVKTEYDYAGAQETIQNFEQQQLVPNPAQLAYSIAIVRIDPQNRRMKYEQEDFCDASGKILWTYNTAKEKEINSQQSFDEEYYTAIVDAVFRHGETDRRKAADRWVPLWTAVSTDGSATTSIADSTTMRLKGDNLIFWEWVELKDGKGNVKEVKFMKKAVNLAQGTQRVEVCRYWKEAKGWQDLTDELDGMYTAIREGSYEERGLTKLRAYANGYQYWLRRYSIDG